MNKALQLTMLQDIFRNLNPEADEQEIDWDMELDETLSFPENRAGFAEAHPGFLWYPIDEKAFDEEEEALRSMVDYLETELAALPNKYKTLADKGELEEAKEYIDRLKKTIREKDGWIKKYEQDRRAARRRAEAAEERATDVERRARRRAKFVISEVKKFLETDLTAAAWFDFKAAKEEWFKSPPAVRQEIGALLREIPQEKLDKLFKLNPEARDLYNLAIGVAPLPPPPFQPPPPEAVPTLPIPTIIEKPKAIWTRDFEKELQDIFEDTLLQRGVAPKSKLASFRRLLRELKKNPDMTTDLAKLETESAADFLSGVFTKGRKVPGFKILPPKEEKPQERPFFIIGDDDEDREIEIDIKFESPDVKQDKSKGVIPFPRRPTNQELYPVDTFGFWGKFVPDMQNCGKWAAGLKKEFRKYFAEAGRYYSWEAINQAYERMVKAICADQEPSMPWDLIAPPGYVPEEGDLERRMLERITRPVTDERAAAEFFTPCLLVEMVTSQLYSAWNRSGQQGPAPTLQDIARESDVTPDDARGCLTRALQEDISEHPNLVIVSKEWLDEIL